MTTPTDPTERAKTYSRYKQALRTERDLKPTVRAMAAEDLKAGAATVAQLAEATGMTPEVFRRIARDLELPVDPRYEERAAASRKKPAQKRTPTGPEAASVEPPRLPGRIAALSDKQASELADRAYAFATTAQSLHLDQVQHEADYGPLAKHAVVAAALELQPPLLTESDLRSV
jgi:hypothetical protein